MAETYFPTEQEMRQGRRRLRNLLPVARAFARNSPGELRDVSALADATLPHAKLANIKALVVYPARLGGWHADALFKQVPPGVPNSMGSPSAEPHKTREMAEDAAMRLLAMILQTEEAARNAEPKDAVFMLHDAVLRLPARVYEAGLQVFPGMANGFGSVDRAVQKVEEMLDELFPDGYSFKALQALPRDAQLRLQARLLTATLSGLFAYPPRRAATPSGHAEGQTSQARH